MARRDPERDTVQIGYLKRLGVTALWISPMLRQRPGVDDYHGYGTQNFLEVDPHFGTAQDFKELVTAAHDAGLYVILDVILNHSADVFQYATVDPPPGSPTSVWTGATYPVPVGGILAALPACRSPRRSIRRIWTARSGRVNSSPRRLYPQG